MPAALALTSKSPRMLTVTERLRALLLDGDASVADGINEGQLASQFGVSRTPVRAALQTLAAEGLLDYVPNRGYSVRNFALAEIMDAYEMRALAEGLAAQLAAERGFTSAQQVAISDALDRGNDVLYQTDDAELQRKTYSQINDVFHHTIHAAAQSRLVLDVLRVCHRIPQASSRNIVAFEIEDVRQRHAAHHQIYEAILFRQPQRAAELMRAHVLSVKSSLAHFFVRHDVAQARERSTSEDAARRNSGDGEQ